ncbi:MAG: hypothetical protein Q4F11_03665 [Eubacteriales bacterium]|nr:hypothetical protein [Eubacteriales bacterium]
MKKNEIILARIFSTASASALALLILIAGVRIDYFSRIAAGIDNSTLSGSGANIYNYYYYSGLDAVYRLLFIAAATALVISVIAVLFKLKGCGIICRIAGFSTLATGVYLLLAGIFEKSQVIHSFIIGFYMEGVQKNTIEAGHFLPKVPVCAVLLVTVSIILLLLVRVTKFEKIKLYINSTEGDAMKIFIAVFYGSIFMDLIRGYIVQVFALNLDQSGVMAYTYLKEYFVAERWLLCIPLAVYGTVTMVLAVVLRNRLNKMLYKILCMGVPVSCAAVIGIYYMLNPARIFGRLTLDEHVCDLTEAAMIFYVLQIIAAVVFMVFFIYSTYMKNRTVKMLFVIMAVNAVSCLLFMAAGKAIMGLAGIYAGCFFADLMCSAFVYSSLADKLAAKATHL